MKNQYLSLEETAYLFSTTLRTVRRWLRKGLITRSIVTGSVVTINAKELIKNLGVENLDEPFLTKAQVVEILGIPYRAFNDRYRAIHRIRAYRLSNHKEYKNQGFLFRKSDLDKINEERLQRKQEREQEKNNKISWTDKQFNTLAISINPYLLVGISEQKKNVWIDYMKGMSVQEISITHGFTKSKVNQIVSQISNKLDEKIRAIGEFMKVLDYPPYNKMNATELFTYIQNLEKDCELFRNTPDKCICENVIKPEDHLALQKRQKVLSTPIENLKLSTWTHNALNNKSKDGQIITIRTIEDLTKCSASELMSLRSFGPKCLFELKEKLARYGEKLKDD